MASNSLPLEGIAVLVTDFHEGVCFSLLDFLIANKAVPYVLIRDFERSLQEVNDIFPDAVPIILDYHKSAEATTFHIKALPPLTCIFNLNGDSFENLYRETFEEYNKSNSLSMDHFDEVKVYSEILEAIKEGYCLFCNFVSLSLAIPITQSSLEAFLLANPIAITTTLAATSTALNSSRNLKFVFEKIFSRQPDALVGQNGALKRKKESENPQSAPSQQQQREGISFGSLLRKFFTKFNPCGNISVLRIIPTRPARVKVPSDIKKYIVEKANADIKKSFQIIHESAVRNWRTICEANFQFSPPEIEKRFTAFCEEVERQSEEGRKVLLDQVEKDIERTKHWDHVLGAKAIERLRLSRVHDIEMRVNLFYNRKIEETRKKINAEIQNRRNQAKNRFYMEILEEQLTALNGIKAHSAKNKDILMQSYTSDEIKKRLSTT